MSTTPNTYFSKVNKVRDLTRQLKKGKNVKESLQMLILLTAPSKAYAVAGTKKILIHYFQKGGEEIELAEQLMEKIIRLEREFEKKMADLPARVEPVEPMEQRKRKASTASSNGTSSSDLTTASEPKKTKVEAAAPAPVKKPQEQKITADEKMKLFIAKQQAKKLERLQATRTTKVLSIEQSKKQLQKRGRRGF